MNPKNQAWHPLDPAALSLPREVEGALSDGDSPCACVVILVDSAIERDWGAQASLALSKKWAASGHRVILADGCLDRPVLHEVVGVENGEGVSDMVLYGASVSRIAARVENRLVLASAGTPVVQVDDVMNHVRWDMVIRGCSEAGATLVFFASVDTPGVEAMTKRADGVLVLATASKDVVPLPGASSSSLIAVLGPGNGEPPLVSNERDAGDVAVADETLAASEDGGQAGLVEALPGLPEDEERTPVDDPTGLSEEEDSAAFSMEGLPGSESSSSSDVEGEELDTFSMTGLGGGQYEADGDDADSHAIVDGLGDDVVEEPGVMAADGPPVLEDMSDEFVDVSSDMGDVVTDFDDSAAESGDIEGVSYGLDDVPLGVDEVSADLQISSDEAAFEIETTSMLDDAGVEPESPAPADAEADAEDAYGSVDLGVEDSGDKMSEPAAIGLDPLLDEELDAALVEKKGEGRQRYRSLARLERRRKRAALARHLLTGVVTLLIVGGGGGTAAYFGLVNIPGITPADRVRSYVPPPVDIPGPVPETAIMSHVLMVDSWRDEETAWSTAEALRSRLPNLIFFVTPVEVNEAPQFALHVGPAYSAVEAEALKEPVAVVLDRLDPNDWEVREAPYAFFFGDYPTQGLAEARVQELATVSVPAYGVLVSYPDGTVGRRVYGGAFSDEYQAAIFGRIIDDAELGEVVLTARRGALPE